VVAETARRDAERHLHAQVLVERVRADGQAIAAVHWQGLASLKAGAERPTPAQSQLVHRGLADWGALSAALTEFRAVEPGAASTRLTASADTMYLDGMRAFLAFNSGDIRQVLRMDATFLRPQFQAFDAYAQQAAAHQEAVPTSRRSTPPSFTSGRSSSAWPCCCSWGGDSTASAATPRSPKPVSPSSDRASSVCARWSSIRRT
jgi:hypothetical protein